MVYEIISKLSGIDMLTDDRSDYMGEFLVSIIGIISLYFEHTLGLDWINFFLVWSSIQEIMNFGFLT